METFTVTEEIDASSCCEDLNRTSTSGYETLSQNSNPPEPTRGELLRMQLSLLEENARRLKERIMEKQIKLQILKVSKETEILEEKHFKSIQTEIYEEISSILGATEERKLKSEPKITRNIWAFTKDDIKLLQNQQSEKENEWTTLHKSKPRTLLRNPKQNSFFDAEGNVKFFRNLRIDSRKLANPHLREH